MSRFMIRKKRGFLPGQTIWISHLISIDAGDYNLNKAH